MNTDLSSMPFRRTLTREDSTGEKSDATLEVFSFLLTLT